MLKGYMYFFHLSMFLLSNLIPLLETNITKSHYGPVCAGTSLTHNCSLQLDDLVNINTIVSFQSTFAAIINYIKSKADIFLC